MSSYTAYGLSISSDLPLPELVQMDPVPGEEPDIIISRGELLCCRPPGTSADFGAWSSNRGILLYWKTVGTFLVSTASRVVYDPAPDAEDGMLRLAILGAVMSVLLHQRGHLVLHASAVDINGAGVIFLGNKGFGKSTMAATLHSRYHTLISDDVVALTSDETGHQILPAFPQLKLWPDAVSFIGIGRDPESLPRLSPSVEKRDQRDIHRFAEEAVPLKRIYVLALGPVIEIQPLSLQEMMPQLICHSYIARYGELILSSAMSEHFTQCSRVAKEVSVFKLVRPSSLSLLPDVARLVEEHTLASL